METIEFDFGKKRYTTKEAGLIFVYETGLELARMYVIALSEKCGTVIFYIPDDLFELISDRAEEMCWPVERYIKELVEYYYAIRVTAEGVAGIREEEAADAVATESDYEIEKKETGADAPLLDSVAESTGLSKESISAAADAWIKVIEAFRQVARSLKPLMDALEYAQPTEPQKSNNWLKMHGFPMRRKGKGRKNGK